MHEHNIEIGPFVFASGERLESVRQRITTYGDPHAPAVLVPHALTGSSRVRDWWGELVGEGKLLDPSRWYVIGINALGSCYGSSGPSTVADFPYVTVRDIVAAQARALDALGVHRLALVIGASLGGMQALQWALDFPARVERAVMVGSHDHQSAMGIALNAIQREAIAVDPARGLRIARKVAMLSYKSDALFKHRHDRRADRKGRFRFDVEGYLEHQADVFEARMDPRSYVALTEAMDSFDVRNYATQTRHSQPPRHGELVELRGEPVKPHREPPRHGELVELRGEPVKPHREPPRHGELVEPRGEPVEPHRESPRHGELVEPRGKPVEPYHESPRHGELVEPRGEPVEPHRESPRHGELVEPRGEPVEPPHLLFVGISSDWLFLPQDVRAAARRFTTLGFESDYVEIESDHGHDAFLAEPEVFASILTEHGVGSGVRRR